MDAQLRVLNLSRDCTEEQVRKAYHTKALQLHPDRSCGNAAAFQRVQAAYEEVLRYVKRRNGGGSQTFLFGRSSPPRTSPPNSAGLCKSSNQYSRNSSHPTSTAAPRPTTPAPAAGAHRASHMHNLFGRSRMLHRDSSEFPHTHAAASSSSTSFSAAFAHRTRHLTPPHSGFRAYDFCASQTSFSTAPCRPVSPLLTEQELFADMAPPQESSSGGSQTRSRFCSRTWGQDEASSTCEGHAHASEPRGSTGLSASSYSCGAAGGGGGGGAALSPARPTSTTQTTTPPRDGLEGNAVSQLQQKWASVNAHIRCKLDAASRKAAEYTAEAQAARRRTDEDAQLLHSPPTHAVQRLLHCTMITTKRARMMRRRRMQKRSRA